MIRAIIIDDEEKSRKLLVNLLDLYCDNVEVLDLADSVDSGLRAIKEHQPDLIFLDIVMPDGDGFLLLAKLEKINFEVIFTTAYGEYAIKALRENALDYLLKPIDVEELQNSVKRARIKLTQRSADIESTVGNKLANLLQKYDHLDIHVDKIGIPNQNGLMFISINDIALCKAEGNYTEIYFVDSSTKEVVSKTLKEFEKLLKAYNFLRIHRSYLINLNNIKEYHRVNHSGDNEGNGGCVVLINGLIVPVSRDRRKHLLSKYVRPM